VAKASVRKVSVRTMKGRKEKKKGAGRRTLLSFMPHPLSHPIQGGAGGKHKKQRETLKPTQKKMAQRGRLLEKFRHLG
jgi:hypothetical protein